jgi:hypothetical protein
VQDATGSGRNSNGDRARQQENSATAKENEEEEDAPDGNRENSRKVGTNLDIVT